MVPDEQPNVDPVQATDGAPLRPRRRSRRGGRRHSRARGPRPDATGLPPESPQNPADISDPVDAADDAPSREATHSESPEPRDVTATPYESDSAAAGQDEPDSPPDRMPSPAREPMRESPPSKPPEIFAVSKAIDQVNHVIADLKQVLVEMEELLETLELAERQKIDDERELESLHRALRRMHNPREGAHRH